MHPYVKASSSLLLATALLLAQTPQQVFAQRSTKRVVKPSIEARFEQFQSETDARIRKLEQQLAERDRELQRAHSAAATAQASAAETQQQSMALQQVLSDTGTTALRVESTATMLEARTSARVVRLQQDQATLKAEIETPSALHYKGIRLIPGGYVAAETVYRSQATGGGTPTAFCLTPFSGQSQARMSEFSGDGRVSRISLLAEGRLNRSTLRAYYEADFLGTGTTSNNNQSNSYLPRQRVLWAQAELESGWTVTGGQMWSLVTETRKGISTFSADVATPQTSDPNYVPGFVWTRQYGLRVTKKLGDELFIAIAAENPQTQNVAGRGFPANFLLGQAGNGAGTFNSLANYSFNLAPDLIAKMVVEPGWGHFELYGLARFFRNRIYPNYALVSPDPAAKTAGAYNDSTVGGAVGGGFRVPFFHKKLEAGLKGQWGDGGGRYSGASFPDMTIDPNGRMALLHNFSALATVEAHATHRLDLYANYGGDYVGRRAFLTASGQPAGYGSPLFDNTGCGAEPLPAPGGFAPGPLARCTGDNRAVQEATLGAWLDFYKGSRGRLRQGLQYAHLVRQTWSGVGGAPRGENNMFFTTFIYYLP